MKIKRIPLLLLLTSLNMAGCNSGSGLHSSLNNSNPNLKIVGGEDLPTFQKNNKTQIANLAKAVIGFETLNTSNISSGRCTGVAIGPNVFLTAAHCVTSTEVNYGPAYETITNIILEDGNNINLFKAPVKVKYIKGFLNISELAKNKALISGHDLAIVVMTEDIFKNYVPSDKILGNIKSPFNNVTAEELLNELDTRKGNVDALYYTLGWGSHKSFQIRSSRPYLSYYGELGNPVDLTWNLEKKYTDEYGEFNTNILFSNFLKTEKGDSGGPTFICNNQGDNCKLVAVTTGSFGYLKDDDSITTLINPYFDYLVAGLQEIKPPQEKQLISNIIKQPLKHFTDTVYGVRVRYKEEENHCSAIAVSSNQLLTASSCFERFTEDTSLDLKVYYQGGETKEVSNGFLGNDIQVTFYGGVKENKWRNGQGIHDLALITFKPKTVTFNNFIKVDEFPNEINTTRAYAYGDKDLSTNHAYDIFTSFYQKNHYISIDWASNYLAYPLPRKENEIKSAFTYQIVDPAGSIYLNESMPEIAEANKYGNGKNKVIIPSLPYEDNSAGAPVFLYNGNSGEYSIVGIKAKAYPSGYSKYGVTYVQPITTSELISMGINRPFSN